MNEQLMSERLTGLEELVFLAVVALDREAYGVSISSKGSHAGWTGGVTRGWKVGT